MGASNINVTDWVNTLPLSKVNPYRLYVQLPAFGIISAPTWKGASEIVSQYNYTIGYNFCLLGRPSKPTDVNYGLCIRYRVGSTVYRYKLWEDDLFVLNDAEAPLYNGETIKSNFVLEIWSFIGGASPTQLSVIQMLTGKTIVPDDWRTRSNVAVDPEEFASYAELQSNTILLSPTEQGMLFHFDAGAGVTKDAISDLVSLWADQSPAGNDLVQATGAAQPKWFADGGSGITNNPFIQMQDAARFMQTAASMRAKHMFFVFQQNTWTNARFLVQKGGVLCSQVGSTPDMRFGGPNVVIDSSGIALGEWKILSIKEVGDPRTALYLKTWTIPGVAQVDLSDLTGSDATTDAVFTLGHDGGFSGDFFITKIIGYDEPLSDEAAANVLAYIIQKYNTTPAANLPLEFSESAVWLDNS